MGVGRGQHERNRAVDVLYEASPWGKSWKVRQLLGPAGPGADRSCASCSRSEPWTTMDLEASVAKAVANRRIIQLKQWQKAVLQFG
jgi:hypothetical protein